MKNTAHELDALLEIRPALDPSAPDPGAAPSPADAALRFRISDATALHDDPELLAAWRQMLDRGTGPEKLYQTPEFFRYLSQADQSGASSHLLYAVRRNCDGAYVGIVPVRRSEQDVAFRLGPLQLVRRRLSALQVLGSVPLLDRDEPGLASFVFDSLLHRHPDCTVLSMQAVPAANLRELDVPAGLSAYVHNGLRDCHTVPLPENFSTYLQKFSAKKRYNLSRQVRLLGEQAGPVQVCRIEEPTQVPSLIDAMRAVLPAHQFAEMAQQARLDRLARHGLLHSYVIRCGTEDVAIVFGTRSTDVWHIHNIVAVAKYQGLSAGTSAVHLALEDAITHCSFADADFGYGAPNQEFRSTHVLKARATVLVCRRRSATAMLLASHGIYQRSTSALIAKVKQGQNTLKQRRRTDRKPPAAPV